MAERVVRRYRDENRSMASEEITFLLDLDSRFSDSETRVRLGEDVSGCDAFLFQALLDPTTDLSVDQNYMAFLIAVRTLKSWGAHRITGVLPYLAYARQDQPSRGHREPATAQLMADLSREAGMDRLVTWHPHSRQIQAFYGDVAVDILDPLPVFLDAFQRFRGDEEVVAVAPDAGASKLVMAFGREMEISSAVASKVRPKPEQAVVSEIAGDFDGKTTAVVLDDMISSGGTVAATVDKLTEDKSIRKVHLGISHDLGLESAHKHLTELRDQGILKTVVVTNSVPRPADRPQHDMWKVVDLSPHLKKAIQQIHHDQPVWNASPPTDFD